MKTQYSKYIFCFLFLYLFSWVGNTFAQNTYQASKNTIIPPSPDAASLGKYGEIPVDMSTGVPNISIPLYNVQSGNISLPISLSYHAGGFKIGEEASWVGLGWSLNVGGVITRTMRSRPDEGGECFGLTPPYDFENNFPNAQTPNPNHYSLNQYQFFNPLSNGRVDTEPDIFFFNFMGKTGKFIQWFDNKFETIDGQKLEISVTNGIFPQANNAWSVNGFKTFTITDEQGIKYFFGGDNATEITKESSSQIFPVQPYTSSWYLTKVIMPDNSEISFEYVSHPFKQIALGGITAYAYTHTNYSPRVPFLVPPPPGDDVQSGSNSSIQIDNVKKIKKIIFKDGEAVFTASNRNDIKDGLKLDKIDIFIKNVLFKTFQFGYDYFSTKSLPMDHQMSQFEMIKTNNSRLKLLHIEEKSASVTTEKHKHSFEYEEGELPSLYSTEQDHWGYYNGNGLSGLLPIHPRLILNTDAANLDYLLRKGQRKVNFDFAKIGLLKKIIYPTSGYSTFEYEPNTYSGNLINPSPIGSPMIVPNTPNPSSNFTFTNPIANSNGFLVKIEFQAPPYEQMEIELITPPTNPNIAQVNLYAGATGSIQTVAITGFIIIETYKNGQQIKKKIIPSNGGITETIEQMGFVGESYKIHFGGASQVKLVPVQMLSMPTDDETGGARIKKIKHYSLVNDVMETEYKYTQENGLSSGALIKPIPYTIRSFHRIALDPAAPCGTVYPGTPIMCPVYDVDYYATLMLSYMNGIGATYTGNHVVYKRVEEIKNNTQKIIYEYDNDLNVVSLSAISQQTDRLKKRIVYKNVSGLYKKIQETTNKYEHLENRNKKIRKYIEVQKTFDASVLSSLAEAYLNEPNCGCSFKLINMDITYDAATRMVEKNWIYLKSTTETLYDPEDENRYTQTRTDYEYANAEHCLPTKVTTTHTSSGIKYISKTKYPLDYNLTASDPNLQSKGVQALANAHILGAPIEEQTWKVDESVANPTYKMLAGKLTSYDPTVLMPKNAWIFQTPTPIEGDQTLKLPNETTNTTGKYNQFFSDFTLYNQGGPTERPRIAFDYNSAKKLASQTLENDIPESYLWGYQNQYPIAKALNAKPTDIFYTSFEEETTGTQQGNAKTGKYHKQNGYIKMLTGLTNGKYNLSYWKRENGTWQFVSFNDLNVIDSTFYINAPGEIDELRFHPADALMTTYTYAPLIGMTSQTDTNGQTIYYEYDSFGRLYLVKDDKGNILKHTKYHYKGQQD